MTLKYESEILYGLMKRDGDDSPSDVLPYESELKEKYLNQVLGAYPKLQDYRAEWLNYNLNENLPADFPFETVSNVTEASFQNVVPYEYKSANLKGNTLVNLQQKGTWTINGSGSNQNASYSSPLSTSLLKTSTKYFVKFNKDISTICKQFYFVQSTDVIIPLTSHSTGAYGIITTPSKLGSETTPIHIYPKDETTLTSEQVKDLQVMIIEYVEGMENWDIPYFESMQSVKMPVLTTSNGDGTKTNILTVNEEVELRGIGEVQDELDLLTGELIQRIGVMVLDGINMNMAKDSTNGDYVRFNLKTYKGKNITVHDMKVKAKIKCDKLPVLADGTHSRECIHTGGASDYKLMMWLHKSNLSSLDNNGICQYLQQNPITVQYELKTETIKTVELTCTNEQGQNVQFKPIEGTMHVQTSSDSILPLLDMEVPVEAMTQNLNSFASMEE